MDEGGGSGSAGPRVEVGDRVVWLRDSGPEYGHVRWIGHIPGNDASFLAGVEFVSIICSWVPAFSFSHAYILCEQTEKPKANFSFLGLLMFVPLFLFPLLVKSFK